MADVTIVNKFGTMQGWNSITMNWMGRDLEGITKIMYDDTIPKENAYGRGKMPIGRTEGNYKASFGVTIKKEELDLLHSSVPPGRRLQDIAPSDPVIEYERNDGKILKDRVRNVEIVGFGVEVAQEDGSIDVELECICSHIDWAVLF